MDHHNGPSTVWGDVPLWIFPVLRVELVENRREWSNMDNTGKIQDLDHRLHNIVIWVKINSFLQCMSGNCGVYEVY